MRLAAAVIAAVLSVFTGRPLRCPCRLAALFQNQPPTALIPSAALTEDGAGLCGDRHCSCKSHREPCGPERPAERKPAPDAPCGHCSAVDLVLPGGSGERPVGDNDPGDPASGVIDAACATLVTHRPALLILAVPELMSSAPVRLRYCHSFRC